MVWKSFFEFLSVMDSHRGQQKGASNVSLRRLRKWGLKNEMKHEHRGRLDFLTTPGAPLKRI
jgi:hypothetical protein